MGPEIVLYSESMAGWIPACWFPWIRNQNCNTHLQLSRCSATPRPCLQMNSQCILDKRMYLFIANSHSHLCDFAPSRYKVLRMIHHFAGFLCNKSSSHVWQSGHLCETVLYFSGYILNSFWITIVPLKNDTREFPVTFAPVQLIFQKYFSSNIQHFDWYHHIPARYSVVLVLTQHQDSRLHYQMDLILNANCLFSSG